MRDTKSYYELPANYKLRERAKEMRKAGNLSEVLLWKQLRDGQCNGHDFDRQKIIGNYIVDFFCASCRVVIEVAGKSHDDKTEYDNERNCYLEGLGLTVIHVTAEDVLQRLDNVVQILLNHPALAKTRCQTPPACGRTPP